MFVFNISELTSLTKRLFFESNEKSATAREKILKKKLDLTTLTIPAGVKLMILQVNHKR